MSTPGCAFRPEPFSPRRLDLDQQTTVTVVWINAPVGAGKTAVARALAALSPSARFIDGDDHAGSSGRPARVRWRRATDTLIEMARWHRCVGTLVMAYPLDRLGYLRLRAACVRAHRGLVVINLATPLFLLLRPRGERALTRAERVRTRAMLSEGYGRQSFATFSHPNLRPPAARTARDIAGRIRRAAAIGR